MTLMVQLKQFIRPLVPARLRAMVPARFKHAQVPPPPATSEPAPARVAAYGPMEQRVAASCHHIPGVLNWYPPVMLNAETVRRRLLDVKYVEDTVKLYERLTPDAYVEYLLLYYREGLKRFGPRWAYADIITVLMALADELQPESYLEVGVRRGRSVCAVASRVPGVNLTMFDMWKNSHYAGMDNPGPELVEQELTRIGHTGTRKYVVGNSHQTLREYFAENPDAAFDMITVDGDHSYEGAVEDLCDTLPHLKIGGAVVFDDICHPTKLYLREVWKRLVEDDPRFSACSVADIGYGVGFGVRLW